MLMHLHRPFGAGRVFLKKTIVAAALDGWLTPVQAQRWLARLGLTSA